MLAGTPFSPLYSVGGLCPQGGGAVEGAPGTKGRVQWPAGSWGLWYLWELLAELNVPQTQSLGDPRGGVAAPAAPPTSKVCLRPPARTLPIGFPPCLPRCKLGASKASWPGKQSLRVRAPPFRFILLSARGF